MSVSVSVPVKLGNHIFDVGNMVLDMLLYMFYGYIFLHLNRDIDFLDDWYFLLNDFNLLWLLVMMLNVVTLGVAAIMVWLVFIMLRLVDVVGVMFDVVMRLVAVWIMGLVVMNLFRVFLVVIWFMIIRGHLTPADGQHGDEEAEPQDTSNLHGSWI
jgi:hypothetical protein